MKKNKECIGMECVDLKCCEHNIESNMTPAHCRVCKKDMTPKTNNEWEKEFDERFASIDGEDFAGWIVDKNGKRVSDWNIDHNGLGVVKSFINQLLSSERQRLRDKIKSKNINGIPFLDNQVEALLKLLEE